MPSIIVHHEVSSYVMINYFSKYMSYIDLLFICKQVYDIDSYGFSIRDDKGNKIIDDASIIQILNMNEVEEKGKNPHYVDDDLNTTPLQMKMSKCYTSKPNT